MDRKRNLNVVCNGKILQDVSNYMDEEFDD
jgi:hypothetical protein